MRNRIIEIPYLRPSYLSSVPGMNRYSSIGVYNESESTLKGGPGLFKHRAQKMTVAPPTNQTISYLKYMDRRNVENLFAVS